MIDVLFFIRLRAVMSFGVNSETGFSKKSVGSAPSYPAASPRNVPSCACWSEDVGLDAGLPSRYMRLNDSFSWAIVLALKALSLEVAAALNVSARAKLSGRITEPITVYSRSNDSWTIFVASGVKSSGAMPVLAYSDISRNCSMLNSSWPKTTDWVVTACCTALSKAFSASPITLSGCWLLFWPSVSILPITVPIFSRLAWLILFEDALS